MKTHSTLLTFALLLAATTMHAAQLLIDAPSTVTITGRLMSPSSGWNWTMNKAGVITIKDAGGDVVAEKTWNDYNAANPDTYAAKDSTVSGATVSKPLSFTVSLDAGTYDWGALGSYSQASSGYLWIDLAVTVTPSTPQETWTPFDELVRDWYDLSDWTPDASTILTGQQFTQTKQQAQDWRRGERSITGTERNVTPYTATQQITQTARGTKPKTVPVIAWDKPASIVYGTPLTGTQLNATANVSGSFSYAPAEGAVLNAGDDQRLEATFTPDDPETYSATTASQTITVNRASTTLTIVSPANPTTLAIDSAAALTVGLTRDNDHAALSTASVTYSVAEARGTAAATVSSNAVTMTAGNGDDTLTIRAQFPGNANHLPSAADITFRVPRPGSLVFTATPPLVSPVTLPSAFLHSEHGSTTSFLEVQVSNPGELPVEVSGITVTPELGQVASFALADESNRANANTTLAAGQTRNLKITFHPSRYALNRDAMKITWRCRPNITTVSSGEISWVLEGTGLAPRMATIPVGSSPDLTNPRDLNTRWPALRTQ